MSKQKNILYTAAVLLLISVCFFKLSVYKKENFSYFIEEENYRLFILKYQSKIINWDEIDGKKGVYIFTSYDCPYCRKYNKQVLKLAKDLSKANDVSIYVVELDFDEYKNGKKLNNYLDTIKLETIPSIYLISDHSYIYGTDDIMYY
ncbi:MAG: thioredoxin domain-containing protein [Oribacterium sp.]|nr:thioredoxin domain-containing protein [Oribacterium sp.]